MTKEEINAYGMKITQASKTGIIVLMYEITIRYIEDGEQALKQGKSMQFREELRKARTFLNELIKCLDLSFPIGMELKQIYLFMNRVLQRADISMETGELDRVKGMLAKLQKSFQTLDQQAGDGPMMKNTQQVYAGLTYSRNSLNESLYSDANRGFRA